MAEQTHRPEDIGAVVDPRRLTNGLWRQRGFIAGTSILGMVSGAVIAKAAVAPVFETQSVIECDRCLKPQYGDRELITLQESVKLPQNMEMPRQTLGLNGPFEHIWGNVEVTASIESALIHVTARGESGELAAGLANVVVEAFLETRQQVERDKLDSRVRALRIGTEKARAATLEARERYDRFRAENKIADLPAEREAAIQEAARLRSEMALARGEEQGERARALALRRASSKEPAMTLLQEIEDLPDAKRMTEVKAQLTAARARFSADHPRVLALNAEMEMLERKLAAANDAVTTGRTVGRNPRWDMAQLGILEASAGQEAASSRQSTYEKLAESAAQAASRLSNIEGRASELLSNVQYAERHASTVELDLSLAQDAARTPSTGLRVLAPARTPTTPVKSIRRIVAFLGPVLGSLLASIGIVLRELRGLRIHTAAELAFWGRGPAVAAAQWPRVLDALDELVEDLGQSIQQSSGKTILLGVSSYEMPYVEALEKGIQERLRNDCSSENSAPGSTSAVRSLDSAAALRHAVRDAARVLVVVAAGRHSAFALRAFVEKLSYPGRLGFVLLDLREDHAALPDVAGDVAAFWSA